MEISEITGEYGEIFSPIIYYDGQIVSLIKDTVHGSHMFGGDLCPVSTAPKNYILHQLFTIDTSDVSFLRMLKLAKLPLVFPFTHDSGSISYIAKTSTSIVVETVLPEEPSDDWPYENYPEKFKVVGFKSSDPISVSFSAFEQLLPQGIEANHKDDIVIVIPPNEEFGVSLWGEDGDMENVLCVFYVDPNSRRVCGYNQCG